MTVLDPHPELRTDSGSSSSPSGSGSGSGSGSLDSLVADCVEVRRHLAEVPGNRPRLVPIPSQAVAMVVGLETYGA